MLILNNQGPISSLYTAVQLFIKCLYFFGLLKSNTLKKKIIIILVVYFKIFFSICQHSFMQRSSTDSIPSAFLKLIKNICEKLPLAKAVTLPVPPSRWWERVQFILTNPVSLWKYILRLLLSEFYKFRNVFLLKIESAYEKYSAILYAYVIFTPTCTF